jgi:hypothetical protein
MTFYILAFPNLESIALTAMMLTVTEEIGSVEVERLVAVYSSALHLQHPIVRVEAKKQLLKLLYTNHELCIRPIHQTNTIHLLQRDGFKAHQDGTEVGHGSAV